MITLKVFPSRTRQIAHLPFCAEKSVRCLLLCIFSALPTKSRAPCVAKLLTFSGFFLRRHSLDAAFTAGYTRHSGRLYMPLTYRRSSPDIQQ